MSTPWQDLTDMFNEEDQAAEMSKKYRNTWLKLSYDGRSFLALYSGMNDCGNHVFRDKHNEIIELLPETTVKVEIWQPRRGLYNTSIGVVFFCRTPFRQYRRGLNNEAAAAYQLKCVFDTLESNVLNSVVYDIFDPKMRATCNLDTALLKANETGAWAINRTFAVTLNPYSADKSVYGLFYETCPIGSVTSDRRILVDKLFFQEVLDSLEDWAPNYEVLVL